MWLTVPPDVDASGLLATPNVWAAEQTFGAGVTLDGGDLSAPGATGTFDTLACGTLACTNEVSAAAFVGDGAALTGVDLLHALGAAEVSVTGATTATLGRMHACSGTTADYTVTLPTAVGNAGKFVGFRMAGGLTKRVTLDGNGSETVAGAASRVLWENEAAVLLSDGSNWVKVFYAFRPMACIMRLSAHQTGVATATVTKVQLDTTVSDNTGFMADTTNKRVNLPRAGQFRASGAVAVGGASGGAALAANSVRVLARLHHNGAVVGQAECSGLSGGYPAPNVVKPHPVAPGDTFELYGYQDTGSDAHFYGGAGQETHLAVVEEASW